MAVAVERSGLKSAPTGPDEALDFAAPFTFLSEKKKKERKKEDNFFKKI